MFILAAIPKLAVFLIVFFVTVLIVSATILLRVVFWEESRRSKLDREAWKAKQKGENDNK